MSTHPWPDTGPRTPCVECGRPQANTKDWEIAGSDEHDKCCTTHGCGEDLCWSEAANCGSPSRPELRAEIARLTQERDAALKERDEALAERDLWHTMALTAAENEAEAAQLREALGRIAIRTIGAGPMADVYDNCELCDGVSDNYYEGPGSPKPVQHAPACALSSEEIDTDDDEDCTATKHQPHCRRFKSGGGPGGGMTRMDPACHHCGVPHAGNMIGHTVTDMADGRPVLTCFPTCRIAAKRAAQAPSYSPEDVRRLVEAARRHANHGCMCIPPCATREAEGFAPLPPCETCALARALEPFGDPEKQGGGE